MKQCPVAKRGVQKHQFVLATAVAMFFCQPSHAPLVEAAQGYPWLQRWPGRRHAGSLVNFCSGVHRWLQYVTLVGMARSSTHDMNMCVCVLSLFGVEVPPFAFASTCSYFVVAATARSP